MLKKSTTLVIAGIILSCSVAARSAPSGEIPDKITGLVEFTLQQIEAVEILEQTVATEGGGPVAQYPQRSPVAQLLQVQKTTVVDTTDKCLK